MSLVLCELCRLEDRGTTPCVLCGKHACIWCSMPAVPKDEEGQISQVIPDALLILCTACNPPSGGPRARLLPGGTPPSFEQIMEYNRSLIPR